MSRYAAGNWITVHPNGPDSPGQPVMIDDSGKVTARVGGNLDGKKLGTVKHDKAAKSEPPRSKAEDNETEKGKRP